VSGHSVSVTAPLGPASSLPAPSIELGRRGAHLAIGTDDDAVDALLRLVELVFAMTFQLGSPLIALDGLVELDLAGFQAPHDLLQLGERILETHRRNLGGPNGIADWRIAHLRFNSTQWKGGCGGGFVS